MKHRLLLALGSIGLLALVAWLGATGTDRPANAWVEVAPGILRSPGMPVGYALVDGEAALLIDAPEDDPSLRAASIRQVEAVLLTHAHRDTCAAAQTLRLAKVPVRAAKKSAPLLQPEPVTKYWRESLPQRTAQASYLVVPVGIEGVDCSLEDGQEISWHSWTVRVVETPGHSPDHLSFTAQKGKDGLMVVFCGDALSAPGKLWSPYTTDWDHWTDLGLKPAAASLRKLAALKPALLLPAHGPPITEAPATALTKTADAAAEVGFLKSFERYTKERLGDAPQYAYLAKEQAMTAGKVPWSQVSKNLFLTGNTYVLTSKEGPFLVVDPFGQIGADQIAKLKKDRNLGPMEVALISHAHWDHYDGIYAMPDRDKFAIWTLDPVADVIGEPLRLRAPYIDARPIKTDRRFKDGDTATWREYTFKFRHFPGQTEFTMSVETTIDGKKCLFTADNFFHQDMFSGSGGWMGLNRSSPVPYAASARMVLELAPD